MTAVLFSATLLRDEGPVGVRRRRKTFSLTMPTDGDLTTGIPWDLSASFTNAVVSWKFLKSSGLQLELSGTAMSDGVGHTSASNAIKGRWVDTTTDGAPLALVPDNTDVSGYAALVVEVEGY